MAQRVPLEKIKHSSKIIAALSEARFFGDLQRVTSLDSKSLQTALARLQKGAYVEKTDRGLWKLSTTEHTDEPEQT